MYQPIILPRQANSLEAFIHMVLNGMFIEILKDGPLPDFLKEIEEEIAVFRSPDPLLCKIEELTFQHAPYAGLGIKGIETYSQKPFTGWVEWGTGRGRIGLTTYPARDWNSLRVTQAPFTWEALVSSRLTGETLDSIFREEGLAVLKFPKDMGLSAHRNPKLKGVSNRTLRVRPHTLNTRNCPMGRYFAIAPTDEDQEVVIDPTTKELWITSG